MPEWTPYKIKLPAGPARRPGEAAELETVHHVVHVPEARRVLEDGVLRAGLIYDQSRLNKSRTCVTWLSANNWAFGSIYGNVQFEFPWADIIRGRSVYWVEAMTEYNPHAYRLLVTDRDLSGSRFVEVYDPATAKGPLRERDGTWYWNPDFTSEFMIDADLGLDRATGFEFITHHRDYCRLNGNGCRDKRASPHQTGGRVLAFILGNDIHVLDHLLGKPSIFDKTRKLSDTVDIGISGIRSALGATKDMFGGAIRAESSRQSVVRGALALYGADQRPRARELISVLKSQETFEEALCEIVNAHFRVTGWTVEN
jgi:hypothetical protein